MPEFKQSFKLSDDQRQAIVTYAFRNTNEALAFMELVSGLMLSMQKLTEAKQETEGLEDTAW